MKNITDNMTQYLQDDGTLPAYAWPGGYPLYYLDTKDTILCPDCANDNDQFTEPIAASDINWEDIGLNCDHCGKHIDCAYGDEEKALDTL
jgi:hypothetical protein